VPWKRVSFKGAEVLARCDAAGKLLAQSGRVEIRYRPEDARAYHAALTNLEERSDSPVLPDETCVELPASEHTGAELRARSRRTTKASRPSAIERARPEIASSGKARSPDELVAYTDGACSGNPGPAGVGVVLIDRGRTRELSVYLGIATNNIAELTAIELAVRASPSDRPLRVHTDSQYAIGVLTKGWKAKANQELIGKLRALLATRQGVEIVYVPGHAGVLLNERADVLAVQAVQARGSTPWQTYGA
jgi:ribonuclease HI